MPKDASGVLSEIKRSFIQEKLKSGFREDGRKLDEMRKITIDENYVPRAQGSAFVQLGKTKVIVGIKIESGAPFPDTPNLGVMTTNVEMLPMAFPTFEPGPPNEDSIEIARVVDRGIRESKMIDLEKLCIEPGKKVMIVFIDIDVIDFDGNIIDACTMGVVKALSFARYKPDPEGDELPVPINNHPISVTMVKIGNEILCDPNLEEEQMSNARITVTMTEDGKIRAMQKGNIGSFTLGQINEVIQMSERVGNGIREQILGEVR
ncbi:MAG: exosome complex protein Rrp42 [Candidatus Thermoplasmatota archaeon]|jgi:exosome complex component RRP42|nr:exosome complex protein Rrp42 [Candidatus Thermoplasmatota archaeon]